jgi:hypothetical protein
VLLRSRATCRLSRIFSEILQDRHRSPSDLADGLMRNSSSWQKRLTGQKSGVFPSLGGGFQGAAAPCMANMTLGAPMRSDWRADGAGQIGHFLAPGELTQHGQRGLAIFVPTPRLKNVANWQTQFFFLTQYPRPFDLVERSEFANRGKLRWQTGKLISAQSRLSAQPTRARRIGVSGPLGAEWALSRYADYAASPMTDNE